jgi:hypothetical protein
MRGDVKGSDASEMLDAWAAGCANEPSAQGIRGCKSRVPQEESIVDGHVILPTCYLPSTTWDLEHNSYSKEHTYLCSLHCKVQLRALQRSVYLNYPVYNHITLQELYSNPYSSPTSIRSTRIKKSTPSRIFLQN